MNEQTRLKFLCKLQEMCVLRERIEEWQRRRSSLNMRTCDQRKETVVTPQKGSGSNVRNGHRVHQIWPSGMKLTSFLVYSAYSSVMWKLFRV